MSAAPTPRPARRSPLADRAERLAVRLILALPSAVKRRLAGAPSVYEGLRLDLDTQLLLRLAERDPDPPLRTLTPLQARAQLQRSVALVAGKPAELAEVRELSLDGCDCPLRSRLYVPYEAATGEGPLLVYFHGGGWVVGDLDTHDELCRSLAVSSGARVLSVDYRLAPENPFPAAVEDALAAYREAVARADELGADPARVAVGGDSAGGHLAAVTALLAREDERPPAFQLLIYPATDFVETSASRVAFGVGHLLTKENMDWYEENFVSSSDRSDPRISPLRAESLAGVAPALVVTAGFDPLRDEGEAYARRLGQDGVAVSLRRHAGFVHGFTHVMVGGSGPREAIAEMGGALRVALAKVASPADVP